MSHALHDPASPTYADIEALPPNVIGEILAGELVVSPRPAGPHTEAASVLGAQLINPFHLGVAGPGGWRILFEPELSLPVDPAFDPVVPDLAGWHIDVLPERVQTAQVTAVPQWVCEVLSPNTQRADRLLKLPFYARAGVGHTWLVDPLNETLEVFALRDDHWVLLGVHGGDEVVRAAPFDALELPLSFLWGRARPAS